MIGKNKNKIVVLSLLLGLFFLVYLYADAQLEHFPDIESLGPELYREPRQTPTNKPPFTITARGNEYKLVPLFEYELHGMIVSYNQNSLLWAVDHWLDWRDFVNIKDLCVIWGNNVATEVYQDMTFINGSYTCYARFKPDRYYETGWRFNPYQLSNNHILSDDKVINRRLLEAQRGDQVYLKGYLVDYTHQNGHVFRTSSITRTDTKCETIYLTDFRILKKANVFARRLRKLAFAGMLTCLALIIWFDRYILDFAQKYARPKNV